ncbi:LysR family transcriptional regulator [Arenibaculum pallidiluteum]|uniref:LysR family transcriptional regulator n=1 Tax=Arenibaculum pallidiluteum TaxID=2812559 RepID=UPI001A9598E2|nr:LysR family transcriptional regulator [Arenibaculum pallidiluteum]
MHRISDTELRLLRVFVAVADAGGFAAAQPALNIGATTVSNHMASLEERLGVKLCERGRGGFRLTDKGRIVYDSARRLLEAAEAFRSQAASLKGTLAGELRIGLLDSTASDPDSPMIPAIRRFSRRDHQAHLRLSIDGPQELERLVLDGSLDLAIGSFPRRVPSLVYTPIYAERQDFYCGRGHRLFGLPEAEIRLDEIRRARIVTRGYWNQHDIVRLDLPATAAAATVFEMEAQAMLVLSGAYLGFLPAHYARQWVERGELRALLPEALSYDAPFDLVVRRGTRLSQVAAAFAADLLAERPGAERTGPERTGL